MVGRHVVGAVVAVGVAGQKRHQFARVGRLGDLAVPHQPGEVDDVLVGNHVVGADVLALVLGHIQEHVRVVGVVDHQFRGQPLRAVLQVVGALDVQERQRPAGGLALGLPGHARLVLHVRALHGQVAGVGVAAQPSDVGELAPERPAAPLAAAVPVGDGMAAGTAAQAAEAAALEDQHVVGAVVAVHRGHDPVRGDVFDVHRAGGLQPHRLGPDVLPGRRAHAGITLHQVHVLGEARVQALVEQVADPVDVGVRVVPELGHRVVVVVGPGGDFDVAVAQSGGPVGGLGDHAVPAGAGIGARQGLVDDARAGFMPAAVHQVVDGHRAKGAQRRADQRQQRLAERLTLQRGLVDGVAPAGVVARVEVVQAASDGVLTGGDGSGGGCAL